MATTYILGRFRLDAEAAILFRGAEPLALGQRAVALLRVLVERPRIPVSKDALIEAAWPGLTVEESNLTVQISALRRVFGEEPGGEGWIETLPRRGYRFVGPVSVKDEGAIVAASQRNLPTAADVPSLTLPNQQSIAVLPFQNMSGDPEQTYFSDGISEDIITELSRFHALFVIARTSSFAFRDKSIKIQDIARELGVAYVVEGSVRRAAARVRITAQLIDAGTGNHLWAERYDRDLRDIFTLQDEIARSVASTVSGRVEAVGRDRAVRLSPTALKAHDLLFRARALTSKYTRADNEEARACAERAVEIDPTSAGAHAHLAWCYLVSFVACWTADRKVALAKAYQLAQRACVLDETDSFTHAMLGGTHLFRREYDESQLEVETAIELNPSDSFARRCYGLFLTATGQADAGIEQIDLGQRLNPFDTRWVPWIRGIACFTARRYEEAIASLRQASDPINEVRGWLAASYAQAGRLLEARAMLEEFLRVAESDMTIFPGRRLKDWEAYWHGAMEFRDQKDFDHLFAALRKAGLSD
jgi:TolB-like protein/Tfp pilus assembly protein PilF